MSSSVRERSSAPTFLFQVHPWIHLPAVVQLTITAVSLLIKLQDCVSLVIGLVYTMSKIVKNDHLEFLMPKVTSLLCPKFETDSICCHLQKKTL